MDKVKAVKEILKGIPISGSVDGQTWLAEPDIKEATDQICQLFKVKLPENPYDMGIAQRIKRATFNHALQQVKELNEEK